MHRNTHLAARTFLSAVAVALALPACGRETTTQALALRFADESILARTSAISFLFYRDDDSAEPCPRILAARPRVRPDLGPYRLELNAEARAEGATFFRDDVPVGAWAVLADATGPGGELLGSACAQDQPVRDAERTTIALVIESGP